MLTMQARRLLGLLEKRKYQWVSKEEIEGQGIRRHRDRVRELRAAGYVIENRCARRRGPKLSEYRLMGKRDALRGGSGQALRGGSGQALRGGSGQAGGEGMTEGRGRSRSSIRDAEGAKAPATVAGGGDEKQARVEASAAAGIFSGERGA
ncbi:MAG: hypothetical protein HY234_03760 [Acidobacteria bacterium]|nr:hypothetical protein [Acidobacteriota bacterium]MBI3662153.1 hypothetical protein [Acidobacteriota bacterium]